MEICFATPVICQEWDESNDLRVSRRSCSRLTFTSKWTLYVSIMVITDDADLNKFWLCFHTHSESSKSHPWQATHKPAWVPQMFLWMILHRWYKQHLKGPIADLNNVIFFSWSFIWYFHNSLRLDSDWALQVKCTVVEKWSLLTEIRFIVSAYRQSVSAQKSI